MLHQRPDRFLEASKKTQRHESIAHVLSRRHSPVARRSRACASASPTTTVSALPVPTTRGPSSSSTTRTGTSGIGAAGSPSSPRSAVRTSRAIASSLAETSPGRSIDVSHSAAAAGSDSASVPALTSTVLRKSSRSTTPAYADWGLRIRVNTVILILTVLIDRGGRDGIRRDVDGAGEEGVGGPAARGVRAAPLPTRPAPRRQRDAARRLPAGDGRVSPRLQAVVVNAADPPALAEFWGELLGVPVTQSDPDWAQLEAHLAFQSDPSTKNGPNRLHFDIRVDD